MARSNNPRPGNAAPPTRKRNGPAIALLLVLSAMAFAFIYLLGIFYQVSRDLPSLAEIGSTTPESGTRLYYSDLDDKGRPILLAVIAGANRQPVKLDRMARQLREAVVATEDWRFYTHSGVDLRGVARAITRNIVGGDMKGEGASTITQQLARNVLGLTRAKVLRRKVAEAILAHKIEQQFTKEEILENYLNVVYLGHGAYGVEAASRIYFNRSAADLSLAESALLAGIIQRPSVFAANREAARRRRSVVLGRMVATGKITPAERDKADKVPMPTFIVPKQKNTVYAAPFFVDYVTRQLIKEYGVDAVYSGMRVFTTLDSRMQSAAEDAVRRGLERAEDANQAALVCIDNKTGYIRAMVGGVDYGRDQFNIVVQGRRQPGSTFKPIVYTAAIDTGKAELDTTFRDDPNFPWRGRDKWIPRNYTGRYSYSDITVRTAIRRSINTVAVKAAVAAGIPTVIDYAHRFGITSPLDAFPTLALGASAVSPLELCRAYTVFPNNGQRVKPQSILKVQDRSGQVFMEASPEIEPTGIGAHAIEALNEALREVVTSGTGTAAAAVPEAHGKTGTTSDSRDAWFAGYTPELSCVVWVAHEKRNRAGRVVSYSEMDNASGGRYCAPIWREFMLVAGPLQKTSNEKGAAAAAATDPATEEAKPAVQPLTPDSKLDTPSPEEEPAAVVDGNAPEPAAPDPQGEAPPDRTQPPTQPEPTRPVAEPAPRQPDPNDEVVTVSLCAETMRRANPYCPVTVQRALPRRNVPGLCRVHKPPPGEGR